MCGISFFLSWSKKWLTHRIDSSTETLKYPCWHRQKMENDRLTDKEKENVANYIARNLRRWFSVIGVFEKCDESMAMFEHALGETFSKCSSNRNVRSFQEETMMTNKAHLLSNEDRLSEDDDSEEYEDDIDMLRDDFYVQRALSPSNTIYAEAKRCTFFQVSNILAAKRVQAYRIQANTIEVVQIFSINVNSDQDYQRYASRRKSSVVREISGRIHSVLNREEEEDVDSSVDGVFRLRGEIDIRDVVPSDSQPTVEAQHFQRRGSSLTNG
uniref:Uncharacterized protein n=1 Tax=Magallana gigas TaxID=29159 RepID=K1R2R4_MAGGI